MAEIARRQYEEPLSWLRYSSLYFTVYLLCICISVGRILVVGQVEVCAGRSRGRQISSIASTNVF